MTETNTHTSTENDYHLDTAPPGPQTLVLTDTFGIPVNEIHQPNPGSVVMVGGLLGVAWQRHANGGKWHSTTGATRSFSSLMRQRNVVLVYAAEVRDDG